MDLYRRNAYRLLGLTADAGMDEVRARAEALRRSGESADVTDAMARLEVPYTRLREHVFGPRPAVLPLGRAVQLHAELSAGSRDVDAWGQVLRLWSEAMPGLRADLAVWGSRNGVEAPQIDAFLSELPAEILAVSAALGRRAILEGDADLARLHVRVIAESPMPEHLRGIAQRDLVAGASDAARAQIHELLGALKEGEAPSRVAGKADQRTMPAIGALKAFEGTAEARDEAAILCFAIADKLGDAEAPTWAERALATAATESLRAELAGFVRKMKFARAFPDLVELLNRGKVEKARRRLLQRRKVEKDADLKRDIEAILADPRGLVGRAGSVGLHTINGIGTSFYGSRDRQADGTYITNLFFCVVFIPFIPISSYLVRDEGVGQYRIFGKVPAGPIVRWWRRLAVGGILGLIALIVGGIAWDDYQRSPAVVEGRALARAESHAAERRHGPALSEAAGVLASADEVRRKAAEELGRRVLQEAAAGIRGSGDAAVFLGGPGKVVASMGRERRTPWLSPGLPASVEAAVPAVARESATAARDLIAWAGDVLPGFRRAPLALSVARETNHAALIAASLRWCAEEKHPAPPEFVKLLRDRLLAGRYDGWDTDSLDYIRLVGPEEGAPVVFARAEKAWKGEGTDAALAEALADGPLRELLHSDGMSDPVGRAARVEKVADAVFPEPQQTWHRLGVARRLADLYRRLNEQDPLRYPASKGRPWAIRAAELAPDDAELRVFAVRALTEDGELARAIALGERGRDHPPTLLALGIAYARAGRPVDAEAAFGPRVRTDFQRYVELSETWRREREAATQSLVAALEAGTADQAFIARVNAMSPQDAQAAVGRWIEAQLKGNARLSLLEREIAGLGDVHAAAIELAMLLLQSARTVSGDARLRKLRDSEELFLLLRRVSDDDPHQDLMYGQVCYWLGKEKQGREIFDRLEKSGDGRLLLMLGDVYRDLGRDDDARRVLEASFAALPAAEKTRAAALRALTPVDLDDALAWLQKADPADAGIRNELDSTRGKIALRDGKWSEAAVALRRVAAYYAGLSQGSVELNNAGLAQLSLYQATGERTQLVEALRFLRKAVEADRESAIGISNYLEVLQLVAFAALAGDALRADLLHSYPTTEWADFATPAPGRNAVAERARKSDELRIATELAPRVDVLRPGSGGGWNARLTAALLRQDEAAVRRLREEIEAANLNRDESVRQALAFQQHGATENDKREAKRTLERLEADLAAVRAAGHAPTTAFALTRLAEAHRLQGRFEADGAAFAEAVRCAREALALHECRTTLEALTEALADLALHQTAAKDDALAELVKGAFDAEAAVVLWMHRTKKPRAKIDGLAEAAEAAARSAAVDAYTTHWCLLAAAGHPKAEDVRKAVVAEAIALESVRVRKALDPQSAVYGVRHYAAAMCFGDKEQAAKAAEDARRRGIAKAFFGE